MAYLSCGEGEFPITRYCEVVRERLQRPEYISIGSNEGQDSSSEEDRLKHFLDGLHIEKCHELDDVIYTVVSYYIYLIELTNTTPDDLYPQLTRIPSMQSTSHFKMLLIDRYAATPLIIYQILTVYMFNLSLLILPRTASRVWCGRSTTLGSLRR